MEITSSTCRHYTLSNSIMCNNSYPIPILSLSFYTIPLFHFLVSFPFFTACMHVNSNSGLAPKIGLLPEQS